ncbi:tetratricopeptide repeat protein [Sphaerospermopsis aphanizomenoides BCCUSP55]|uniref:tetratricopeptide repeat protein n=1 Tax=Sphaerospermopsis aphanizomenoides TaxID=459663 RepID=UPI001903DB8E|nr:tetratricopeptide repeat protein [Sphaerospermopsis aphanizomenoides]MBK1987569.1 tetratricopeptide repeat protein [Sphaerospermopsis aphanizomenoides BCCUSP55]
MTFLICGSTSERITLLSEIADSGEAKVWRTNHHGYLAKIYHEPTPERMEKLAVMIAHPPKEPNSHLNHISFAWPNSSLRNAQGDYVGFLMPEVKGGKELIDVYNPQRRKKSKLEIDWRFLHTTALNIASIIAALHETGYVLGDINPKNILVNNRALPSIIDTDSFQVKNPKNSKVYRCLVGFTGYTPPELIGKDFKKIDQTEVHDRFRLAVIIYQLLFSGNSPFQGKWNGAGETPEVNELIQRGIWLYSPNNLIQPVENTTIPLAIVHPEIQKCFLRCFNDGHKNPYLRPTAKEWLEALRIGNDSLTVCDRVDGHFYSRTYGSCYWCDRFTKLGVDIFPGNQTSYKNKDADYYINSGVARYNSVDKQGAIDYYNQALKINPNFVHAYHNRGNARYDLGDKKGAIDDYNQALKIDPNYIYAYYGRGRVRHDLGDKKGAIDDYNKALKIDPHHVHAYNGRGLAYYDLGDKRKAINDYNQAINIDPKYVLAYINRGLARYDLDDNQGAIDDYTQALRIDPNNVAAYNNRGLARYHLGDKRGAVDDYNQALHIDPNLAFAYHNRAIARSVLRDRQGAIDDYNQALKINPKYREAYINRAILRYRETMILVLLLILFVVYLFYNSNNFNSVPHEMTKLTQNDSQELTQSELREIANSQIEKYITGIGISFEINEKTKIPTITDIVDNSPAASENLQIGDQILEVDGKSTSRMTSTEVSNLIRGNADTIVFLAIRRSGYGSISKMLIRQTFINLKIDQEYRIRCYANLKLKFYSQALGDCNQAIEINSSNNTAYFTRSRVHFKLGNRNQGMEDLRESARLGNEKAKEILRKNQ